METRRDPGGRSAEAGGAARQVELGVGERRLGQDPGADRPGGAPAPRAGPTRRGCCASPTPRRRPPRCSAAVRQPGRAGRCSTTRGCARRRRTRRARTRHPAGRARPGAHALRPRARDPRRAEDPDDPRLLRGAAATLSHRGGGGAAVRRARRPQARALREEVLDTFALGAPQDFAELAHHFGREDVDALLLEIARHRGAFAGPFDAAALAATLGARPGVTMTDLAAEVLTADARAALAEPCPA